MNKLFSSLGLILCLWVTLSLCVIWNDSQKGPAVLRHAHDACCQMNSDDACTDLECPEIPQEKLEMQPAPKEPTESAEKTVKPGNYTFGIIKPDAVEAGYSGDIIRLIELNGFTIVELHKKQITKQQAEEFYKEHKDKPFFKDLVHFMTSGPVLVLKLKKDNAVVAWRKLMGATNPEKSRVGTLRAMFGQDITHNAVHGSDSDANALRELNFFDLN